MFHSRHTTQIFFTSADEISSLSRATTKSFLGRDKDTQTILKIIRDTLQDEEVSPIWSAYRTADQMSVNRLFDCLSPTLTFPIHEEILVHRTLTVHTHAPSLIVSTHTPPPHTHTTSHPHLTRIHIH